MLRFSNKKYYFDLVTRIRMTMFPNYTISSFCTSNRHKFNKSIKLKSKEKNDKKYEELKTNLNEHEKFQSNINDIFKLSEQFPGKNDELDELKKINLKLDNMVDNYRKKVKEPVINKPVNNENNDYITNDQKNQPKDQNKKIQMIDEINKKISNYQNPMNGNDLEESLKKYPEEQRVKIRKNMEKMKELYMQNEILQNKTKTDFLPEEDESSIKSKILGPNEILEKISIKVKSKEGQLKGSERLIDLLLDLYKTLTNSKKSTNLDRQNFEFFNNKYERETEETAKKVQEYFNKNIVIDSLQIIFRNLYSLKDTSFSKLINVLIKIKFQNNDIWKKILRQYLMYLSLIKTDYQPLTIKNIALILLYLKNNFKNLLFSSDTELEGLIDKSIKNSSNYLLNNLQKTDILDLINIINSLSKLGMLDEDNLKKIEGFLTPNLQHFDPSNFTNILYCFCKNRNASEPFYQALEKKSEDIILNSKGKNFNSFVVSMIAKSLYVGLRNNKNLFNLIETHLIQNHKNYEFHHILITAHSLICMRNASENFVKLLDKLLIDFKNPHVLNEMLCYQINYILVVRNEFSNENYEKYFSVYEKFFSKKMVKTKQSKVLAQLMRSKIAYSQKNNLVNLETILKKNLKSLDLYISKNEKK